MEVLLTGGLGFLGGIIKSELQVKGYTITSLGRSFHNHIVCDLSNQIPDLKGVYPIVIHCAGKAHSVPRTEAEKDLFFDVNVTGTKNLLASLEKLSSPPDSIVFISSVSVYGIPQGECISEEQPLASTDSYGKSKIQTEQLLHSWCAKKKVNLTILRLPLVVGKGAPGNLGTMVSAIRKGYYLNIGGGQARKSMVLANDVAGILPNAIQNPGIYHLTDGHHPSFKELEKKITTKVGGKIPTEIPFWMACVLAWGGDLINLILPGKAPITTSTLEKMTTTLTFDDQKARKELGWNPKKVIDALEID